MEYFSRELENKFSMNINHFERNLTLANSSELDLQKKLLTAVLHFSSEVSGLTHNSLLPQRQLTRCGKLWQKDILLY